VLAAACLLVAACREADRPVGPGVGAPVVVESDPQGGRILVDDRDTGRLTPDTLMDVGAGPRRIAVRLDSAGWRYGFAVDVDVPREGLVRVYGPLLMRCSSDGCVQGVARYHSAGDVRFAASPTGSLFSVDGQGKGIYWPAPASNSYASGGGALFAGLAGSARDPVSLCIYPERPDPRSPVLFDYLAGRPAPSVEQVGSRFVRRQSSWILPPGALVVMRTLRGIAVRQEVVVRADVPGVLLVRLVFRNITAERSYAAVDPAVPAGGLTYESAFIGFGLDVDVGEARDDVVSFDPELRLAFMYDEAFQESGFTGGWADRPALVGVRLLEAPPGTSFVLTAWPARADWSAGGPQERAGWAWLSGSTSVFPDHPDPRIGHAPSAPDDYRIAVSAGPLRFAPGDSAALTAAVLLAAPAAGTYTSGVAVPPGDPLDPGRPILRVAAPLFERARAAEALLAAERAAGFAGQ